MKILIGMVEAATKATRMGSNSITTSMTAQMAMSSSCRKVDVLLGYFSFCVQSNIEKGLRLCSKTAGWRNIFPCSLQIGKIEPYSSRLEHTIQDIND